MAIVHEKNPRQLELFVPVAGQGSFSRGDDNSLRTQSTVSQQIAAFKRRCGTRLFDRYGKRGGKLTAAGIPATAPHPPRRLQSSDDQAGIGQDLSIVG